MSSKYSGNTHLQKNFKVCKIPVADESLNKANFRDYPLQAFASWKNEFSPLLGKIAGFTVLRAFPEENLHFGRIEGTHNALELDLIYNPDTLIFTYIVTLLAGSEVEDIRTVIFTAPQAALPFVAGLFSFGDSSDNTTVTSKIYS